METKEAFKSIFYFTCHPFTVGKWLPFIFFIVLEVQILCAELMRIWFHVGCVFWHLNDTVKT